MMSSQLEYTYLEGDIHKFVWHTNDRNATLEYFEHFKKIHDTQIPNSRLKILHDFTEKGAPPFNAVRDSMKGFEQRADVVQYIAHLYSDAMFPVMMKNIVTFNRIDVNRKFFKADEEQQAIAWLRDVPTDE